MITEEKIINDIQRLLPTPSQRVWVGIGDDCAVLRPPSQALIVSTDALVENVHFDLSLTSFWELGWRSVHVNLSDLAAQGARPQSLLYSLVLPTHIEKRQVLEFYEGVSEAARKTHVDVVGGNLAKGSGPWVINVTAMGEPFEFLSGLQTPRRGHGKVGDWIAITNEIGWAALGLKLLQKFGRSQAEHKSPRAVQRYVMPQARVEESYRLLQTGAVTSMMDISDGLLLDLTRLRGDSKLDIVLEENELTLPKDILRWCHDLHLTDDEMKELCWTGGDDYELLLTLDPNTWTNAVANDLELKELVQVIGEMSEPLDQKSPAIRLRSGSRPERILNARGWDHFKK
jgi:thiamine-monophosphate kinase